MIDPRSPDFDDTPVSERRPRFCYLPREGPLTPSISIITPFWNAGPEFCETARAVLGQSLQQFEWLIVNDGSTDPDALRMLESYGVRDPRIRIIDHPRNLGLSAARNTGFREARTNYVLPLDSDDLLELTAAEKWFWALESRPELAFVKGFSVGFGAQQYLWTRGFHEGERFLEENLVTATALIRRAVHHQVGGYDETNRKGLEDWDFWLRCANAGAWGATIPEYHDWYRRRLVHSDRWDNWRSESLRQFRLAVQARYPQLPGRFPRRPRREPVANDPVPHDLPCENLLRKDRRRLLLIVPWLTMGGADRFNLDLIKQCVANGWDVSVATTLAGDHSWLPDFARLTPDVFPLHHFLRTVDYPRFLRYLIRSRGIDVVLVSNSEFGYLLLPYLRAYARDVTFIDYCHMEEPAWKNGGYPRLSIEFRHNLDLTAVTSHHLRSWMVQRGGDAERIEVCHLGIDPDVWRPDPVARRAKRVELQVDDDMPVILYPARLCPQKQPQVFAHTVQLLAHRGVPFEAWVAGDGPDLPWLRRFLRRMGLADRVRLLGTVPLRDYPAVLNAADIVFLPSEWEGISLTLYEAMACGIPVVGAAVGGQSELVTGECGILLPRSDPDREAKAYTDALEPLLRAPERRGEMGANARERAQAFRVDQMGQRMLELFGRAEAYRRTEPKAVLGATAAQSVAFQVVEYVRLSDLAEWLWARRNDATLRVQLYRLASGWFAPPFDWAMQRGWKWPIAVRSRLRATFLGRP